MNQTQKLDFPLMGPLSVSWSNVMLLGNIGQCISGCYEFTT